MPGRDDSQRVGSFRRWHGSNVKHESQAMLGPAIGSDIDCHEQRTASRRLSVQRGARHLLHVDDLDTARVKRSSSRDRFLDIGESGATVEACGGSDGMSGFTRMVRQPKMLATRRIGGAN